MAGVHLRMDHFYSTPSLLTMSRYHQSLTQIFLLSLPAGWIFNGGSSQITNVITAPAAGSTNAVGETADGSRGVDTTSGIGGIAGFLNSISNGFFGGFTNAQVGQATAPSTFSADGGNSVPTFVRPGTYTKFYHPQNEGRDRD